MKKGKEFFIILLVIAIPILHEVGHYLGFAMDGVPARITYGMTRSDCTTIPGVLGGLLFNVLLTVICLALINIDSKRKNLWGLVGLYQ